MIRWTPLNLAREGYFLDVKYEKIWYFCEVCGLLGHDKQECGDGIHPSEKMQWGKWLVAKKRVTQMAQSTAMGGRTFRSFMGSLRDAA